MKCNLIILIILGVIVFVIPYCGSARILSIFAQPLTSHYIFGSAMLKELAARGHEVTSVNLYPQKQALPNFRDIYIQNNTQLMNDMATDIANGNTQYSYRDMLDYFELFVKICTNTYEHPEIKELMNHPQGKFDLIIVEVMMSDSLYGLGQHFNAPMIGVSAFGTMMGLDEVVANMSPASIIPSVVLPYGSKMNLFQRIHNFVTLIQFHIFINLNYYIQRDMYNKYFPDAKLTFDEAKTDFSLMLLNQHHSLSYPRPYVTNVIEVGGLHIPKNLAPLPADLQEFLDNATEGVVYFSMGSYVKSKDMPIEKKKIFLKVFSSLKQKVLWKFEDSELPDKADNILIKNWLPQQAVLSHPNVKVFITHGGLLSTTEAIYWGKPILGIPMFAEQPKNVISAVNRGIGLLLSFQKLTEKNLKEKLDELLYNPSYTENMKTISSHYHDQPLAPMELAMFWIEYVIRHKGARHLRNAGIYLNIWQYYSVDVVCIILTALLIVIYLIMRLIKKCFAMCKGRGVKTQQEIKLKRG